MGLFNKFFSLFKKSELSEVFYEELTSLLIASDMGVELSEDIIDELKSAIKSKRIRVADECKSVLRDIMISKFPPNDISYNYPTVITIIGVNGVGKTTTIAKMSNYFLKNKKTVLLAAGDTFRAAASSQLCKWAEKLKIKVISQGEGADPGSVVFDAVESAKAKSTDVLIIDTAGRLHTKTNLMAELEKMGGIVGRRYPEAQKLCYIVLDASIGQNSLTQVKAFKESIGIDGIILSKLDGTAKGGIAFPILRELDIPIAFVGFGENVDDLATFDAVKFVDNIL